MVLDSAPRCCPWYAGDALCRYLGALFLGLLNALLAFSAVPYAASSVTTSLPSAHFQSGFLLSVVQHTTKLASLSHALSYPGFLWHWKVQAPPVQDLEGLLHTLELNCEPK